MPHAQNAPALRRGALRCPFVFSRQLVLQRMQAEPLSFGARFSVHLWSASLEDALQPVFAVINYAGLFLYSWSATPEMLCHFSFSFRLKASESTRLLLGWQRVQHTSEQARIGSGGANEEGEGGHTKGRSKGRRGKSSDSFARLMPILDELSSLFQLD